MELAINNHLQSREDTKTEHGITAIIPVYNGGKWIREAIESVYAQTLAAAELIVVDDCSQDNSAHVASSLGAKVIRLPRNSGDAVARNVGIQNAKFDHIAMLDADDLWGPRHLEILMNLFKQHPGASIVCAATERFGFQTGIIPGYVPEGGPHYVFREAFDDWLHTTIGCIFTRNALLSVGGFSEEQKFSADYDLWLRLSRDFLFASTREITSFWRWHAHQQSQSYGAQLKAVYYFRQKLLLSLVAQGKIEESKEIAHRTLCLLLKDCLSQEHRADPAYFKTMLQCALMLRSLSTFHRLLLIKIVCTALLGFCMAPAFSLLARWRLLRGNMFLRSFGLQSRQ